MAYTELCSCFARELGFVVYILVWLGTDFIAVFIVLNRGDALAKGGQTGRALVTHGCCRDILKIRDRKGDGDRGHNI